MYCRVLEGKLLPGRGAEAVEIIKQQVALVRENRGFLFAQALQSGDDFLVVSSWRSEKDLSAYVESDIAHSVITRLSPLMVESPTARNFEMKLVVEGEEGVFTRDEGGEG
jgi:quinol monooxygenase YgiN